MNQPQFCENCGAHLQFGPRFCGSCGHPIEVVPAAASPPAPASPQPGYSPYMPPQAPAAQTSNRGLWLGLIGVAAVLLIGGAVIIFLFVLPSRTAPTAPAGNPVQTLPQADVPTSALTEQTGPGAAPIYSPPSEDFIRRRFGGELLLNVDFVSPPAVLVENWAVDNDLVKGYFEGGEFHMQLKGNEDHNSVFWQSDNDYADFILDTDARFMAGPPNWLYGVVFRYQNGNYYLFLLGYNGDYVLDKHVNGQWTRIREWTKHSSIKTNGSNHLQVMCEGPEVSMYVNDMYLGIERDTTLGAGAVGVYVQGQPDTHIVFNHLKVWGRR